MPPVQSAKNYRNNSLKSFHSLSKFFLQSLRFLSDTWTPIFELGIEDLKLSLQRISQFIQPFPRGIRTTMTKIPLQPRSEEHTSELQSHSDLVCRLLLEKKKTTNKK